ncbi:MAG: hypothetical protein MUE85_15250 [Microscillaceae bacterium]|jgi:hypothetical protein|nr:hypothetical protein [Microscillaceae bacterium]
MPVLLDTNVILKNHIRKSLPLPTNSFISIINVGVGELESLALQLNWSYQKQTLLQNLIN